MNDISRKPELASPIKRVLGTERWGDSRYADLTDMLHAAKTFGDVDKAILDKCMVISDDDAVRIDSYLFHDFVVLTY